MEVKDRGAFPAERSLDRKFVDFIDHDTPHMDFFPKLARNIEEYIRRNSA